MTPSHASLTERLHAAATRPENQNIAGLLSEAERTLSLIEHYDDSQKRLELQYAYTPGHGKLAANLAKPGETPHRADIRTHLAAKIPCRPNDPNLECGAIDVTVPDEFIKTVRLDALKDAANDPPNGDIGYQRMFALLCSAINWAGEQSYTLQTALVHACGITETELPLLGYHKKLYPWLFPKD